MLKSPHALQLLELRNSLGSWPMVLNMHTIYMPNVLILSTRNSEHLQLGATWVIKIFQNGNPFKAAQYSLLSLLFWAPNVFSIEKHIRKRWLTPMILCGKSNHERSPKIIMGEIWTFKHDQKLKVIWGYWLCQIFSFNSLLDQVQVVGWISEIWGLTAFSRLGWGGKMPQEVRHLC